jgi:hypothetical protein
MEHIEKWGHIRQGLFRNEEPLVKLIGVTTPIEEMASQDVTIETLPAYTARQSHESEGTHEDDLRLNKKLISWGHQTCLEAVQFVYYVTGVSKSLAGQWTRHRIGIGWTEICKGKQEYVHLPGTGVYRFRRPGEVYLSGL